MLPYLHNIKPCIAALTIVSTCLTSCAPNNADTCDVMCPDVFTQVAIVTTRNGKLTVLDKAFSVRESNGDTIVAHRDIETGFYTMLDDSYHSQLQRQSDVFTLFGFKDGQKVVEEQYLISADCCHIAKESGRDTVELAGTIIE